jgi:glycerol uptake facilitator-like aquaporin
MKAALWLHIAAVVTFVQAVAHTVGAVFGDPDPGPATVAVEAMRANQFVVMGHLRSYSDFYRALGLGVTIFLTAEAIVFWQLSSLAKTDARRLRPILVTFLVAYAALGVMSEIYLFVGPVIGEVLIAACLGMAIVGAGSEVGAKERMAQRA